MSILKAMDTRLEIRYNGNDTTVLCTICREDAMSEDEWEKNKKR